MKERGMLDRKERSNETRKEVVINEVAMVVVAVNFPDLKNIKLVWALHYPFCFLVGDILISLMSEMRKYVRTELYYL